jgi:Mce-associated membrane protein
VIAELAEAEAAEAQARVEAARAEAHAAQLRSSVEESTADSDDERSNVPWTKLVLAAGVLMICVMLTVSGLMIRDHRRVVANRAGDAEFIAAASQGVVALLSIDYANARADVQRVIDLSTGTFKEDFVKNADDFIKTAEGSKSVTLGSISAAALESASGDTGIVSVAAKSEVTNSIGARRDSRSWRMNVTVTRDGGQLKTSNVEFVP